MILFHLGYGYFGYPFLVPDIVTEVIIEIDLTITMLTLPTLGAPVVIQPTIHQEVDVPAKAIIVQIIQVTILSEEPSVTTIPQVLADIMPAGDRRVKPMVTNLVKRRLIETPLHRLGREQTIAIVNKRSPPDQIPILLQAIKAVTTQEEAMVPLDHHIQVVGVHPVIVQVPEAQEVGAEASLEAGNIEIKFNDYEKFIPHVLMIYLFTVGTYAQYMDDILRYTRTELKGTARYVAMGGAFNALGGDFSAIKDNPASAAVFLNSEIGLSFSNFENRVGTNYFETLVILTPGFQPSVNLVWFWYSMIPKQVIL